MVGDHKEIDRRCDALLIPEIGFWSIICRLAADWLSDGVMEKRQKTNATIVYILKELEVDEFSSHFYQRGFTAGLEAAAAIYGPRRDA